MPRKVDANQAEIVAALRRVGVSVQDTHQVGHGFVDLVVGFRGQTFLLEVKALGGHLERSELLFAAQWNGGQVQVVWDVDGALRAIGVSAPARQEV